MGAAEVLIGSGADVNRKSANGTVLGYAVLANHLEFARIVLQAGADRNLTNGGTPPLTLAADLGHVEMVRLLTSGIDPDTLEHKEGALYWAAVQNEHEIIELLLDLGADPKTEGLTPLMAAVENGHIESIMTLLQGGSDVNARSSGGLTPLGLSVRNNFPDVVTLLIENGADVAVRYDDSATALMFARSPEVVRILLNAGADLEAKDDEGRTPFMCVTSSGIGMEFSGENYRKPPPRDVVGAARVVLEAGADTRVRDHEGRTALILATGRGSRVDGEIFQLLLETGIDPNAQDADRRTALFYAATNYRIDGQRTGLGGDVEAVRLLMQAGADPMIPDRELQTALQIAAMGDSEESVALMLSRPGVLDQITPGRATPPIFSGISLTRRAADMRRGCRCFSPKVPIRTRSHSEGRL